jgi:hypothetical protein
MKKSKLLLGLSFFGALGLVLVAADHIDAPAVQGGTSDITDFYSFQASNTNSLVFVANVKGLLSPTATEDAVFDENVMVEFNIDNNGDNVEDLIIQAIPRNGRMYFFGPFSPSASELSSTVNVDAPLGNVAITGYGQSPFMYSTGGVKLFSGPRDDPFFFDFGQYSEIIAGNASSFNNPGADTFAGTNVMSIVVELPKSMLGGSGTLNTWVETKRK